MAQIAVIIATYGRPESLQLVLSALATQSVLPQEVIVVDATPDAKATARKLYLEAYNLTCLVSNVGSLPAQKNLGIEHLLQYWDGDFIQILDDDTVPDVNFLEKLSQTLLTKSKIVGCSGFCVDDGNGAVAAGFRDLHGIEKLNSFVFSIFGLDSNKPGTVTRGGVGIFARPSEEFSEVEWLNGCSMWRIELLRKIKYNGDLPGSALCEDLDFSTRAHLLGDLITVGSARLFHSFSQEHRPAAALHHYRFARNRYILFDGSRKPNLRKGNYIASTSFLVVATLIQGIFGKDRPQRLAACSNLASGMIDALKNRPFK